MNTTNHPLQAVSPMQRGGHFGSTHPVAAAARRTCRAQQHGERPLVGLVACGPCWEAAIVADWRVMTDFGLPHEQGPDDAIVDAVAVERACSGERVPLNDRERAAAVAVLRGRGLTDNAIARRLGTHGHRLGSAVTDAA